MLTDILILLLKDMRLVHDIANSGLKYKLEQYHDPEFIESLYTKNRNHILDIIRELELGAPVNWDAIYAI